MVVCEAALILDAVAEEDQLDWPDLPLVRISAMEALMAASMETETIGCWVPPAVDVDVLPNVANDEDQQDSARMVPAAEDPDVPCRDVVERVAVEHCLQEVEADRALAVERYPRTAAAVHSEVAMHPEDAELRHRA